MGGTRRTPLNCVRRGRTGTAKVPLEHGVVPDPAALSSHPLAM